MSKCVEGNKKRSDFSLPLNLAEVAVDCKPVIVLICNGTRTILGCRVIRVFSLFCVEQLLGENFQERGRFFSFWVEYAGSGRNILDD